MALLIALNVVSVVITAPKIRRVPTSFVIALCLSAAWGCAADVDSVLVQHSLVSLIARDSAHIRTLVLEPNEGVRIEAAVPPTLARETGERIVFTARTGDSAFFVDAPSARVTLTQPVNGVLTLRACPAAGECRKVSLQVRTRGRTTRGRS